MKKITVTKAYEVSSDPEFCVEGGTGGWNEYCMYYKNPKKKGGVKNTKRIHLCSLFEEALEMQQRCMGEQPKKCKRCFEL